jgi:hypothetical protein
MERIDISSSGLGNKPERRTSISKDQYYKVSTNIEVLS